jgi:dipeptide/tripeptide permease
LQSGISEKWKHQKTNPKPHWLDYAEDKHGAEIVAETKSIVNILVLYIPLPVFWAVSMQQESRWVFQAAKMNGDIGFYHIKPDQMIVLKPFFEILTLPICDYLVYPLLMKVGISKLLHKMTIGGMFGVVGFIVAAFVELETDRRFISMLWMIPQYWILAFAEIFMFASHVNFAFTEAPARMKSVMTSFVFVVMAIGNLCIVLVSGSKLFNSQAVEFFFFAGIFFVFMIFFAFLSSRYKSVNNVSQKTRSKYFGILMRAEVKIVHEC